MIKAQIHEMEKDMDLLNPSKQLSQIIGNSSRKWTTYKQKMVLNHAHNYKELKVSTIPATTVITHYRINEKFLQSSRKLHLSKHA